MAVTSNFRPSMKMSKIISVENPELYELMISRGESAISTEIDNETMILDIASGVYSGLDPVGTTIWGIIESSVSFTDIVKEILANYEVSEEECVVDLVKFLAKLHKIKLIVVSCS